MLYKLLLVYCQYIVSKLSVYNIIHCVCSGQTETRSPSGEKMVEFPDGTIRHIYPNGEERVIFANGTVQYIHTNGDKTIQFTDGQKEIHTKKFKVKYLSHCYTLFSTSYSCLYYY